MSNEAAFFLSFASMLALCVALRLMDLFAAKARREDAVARREDAETALSRFELERRRSDDPMVGGRV